MFRFVLADANGSVHEWQNRGKALKLKWPFSFCLSASAFFSSGQNYCDSRYGAFEFELAQYIRRVFQVNSEVRLEPCIATADKLLFEKHF